MEIKNIPLNQRRYIYKSEPYVGEDGIYEPVEPYVYDEISPTYKMIIPKEIFQEAFKEYIIKEGLLNIKE